MNGPDAAARAGQLREEAAGLPSASQIRELGERAAEHGAAGMTIDEIRALADEAVAGAEQVAALLRRLSDLLGGPCQANGGEA